MERSSIYEALGGNIRRERAERDINQAELARRVGLSRTSVTNVELGRQGLAVHQLFEFADALGVDVSALIPEKPAPRQSEQEVIPAGLSEWVATLKSRSVGR